MTQMDDNPRNAEPAATSMNKMSFRTAALQRLQQPEQIGHAMQLVRSPYQVTLWLIAIAILVFLAVSAVVNVPLMVVAPGVVLYESSTLETTVAAQHEGMISAIHVKLGDSVKAGDVIATIAQPSLVNDLRQALEESTSASDRLETVRELQQVSLDTLGPLHAHLKEEGAESISRLSLRLADLTMLMNNNERLKASGLITIDRQLAIRSQLSETQDALSAKKAAMLNLELDWTEKQNQFAREIAELDDKIAQTRRHIQRLESQIQVSSVIRASQSGRVAEIKLAAGDLVRFNSAIVGLVPVRSLAGADGADPLMAIVLVPISEGKKISIGDTTFLDPANVRRDVYGQIRGRVTDVSATPVTPELLRNLLRNDDLVRKMTDGGPTFLTTVELERSDTTPSGYAWTASRGPDGKLSAGTPLRAEIETERVPLLSLLIPALKQMLRMEPRHDVRASAASSECEGVLRSAARPHTTFQRLTGPAGLSV